MGKKAGFFCFYHVYKERLSEMGKKITLKSYACVVFALFLLVFPGKGDLGGISLRVWLVYLAVAAGGILWIIGKSRGEQYRKIEMLDCLAGVFLVWNLLLVVIRSFSGKTVESALFAAALTGFYLLLSARMPQIPIYRLMTLCSVFPIVGLLWHFLLDESFTFGIELLLQEEGGAVPLLLLFAMGSATGYILGDKILPPWIYLVIAAADFLTLFLTQNIPGVVLGLGGLVLLLLYTGIGEERIKKALQLLLLYVLLLSNMPLLAILWKRELVYGMEGCVYLELVTALVCAGFFSWWDKREKGKESDWKRFLWTVRGLMAGAMALLFLVILYVERLAATEGILARIGVFLGGRIRDWCREHGGTFPDTLSGYGTVGILLLFMAVFLIAEKIRRSKREENGWLCAAVILYIAQSFVFSQQTAAAPVFACLAAAAFYSGEYTAEADGEKIGC